MQHVLRTMKQQFLHIITQPCLLFVIGILLLGCSAPKPQYRIGVSQCSSDAWWSKMDAELQRECILYPEISLQIRSGMDDPMLQCAHLDSFITERVDLIIVSPIVAEQVTPTVTRAYKAGIPVLVIDRQVIGDCYTAYVGGDNLAIGRMQAEWIRERANELRFNAGRRRVRVLEMTGLAGSTPAILRHEGLMQELGQYSDLDMISCCANWERVQAYQKMDSLLRIYGNSIDLIVSQNDQMSIGIEQAVRERGCTHIPIVSVDALAGPGNGLDAICDGRIDACASYYTNGELVIRRALQILRGEPYTRDFAFPARLLDQQSALATRILQTEFDRGMEALYRVEEQNSILRHQRLIGIVGFLSVLVALLLIGLTIWLVNLLRQSRARAAEERREAKRQMLAKQQEIDRQKEKLEALTEQLEQTQEARNTGEDFLVKLEQQIEQHLDDTTFSVEALAEQMGISRTQLFRKTRRLVGISPLDLIHQVRLRRARQLLLKTDYTIQQICYQVGFATPSYFARCYKEYFGVLPNEEKRE